MSISEEEEELNYVKLDKTNGITLISSEDCILEINSFMTSGKAFEEEKIGKKLLNEIKNRVKEGQDIININKEYVKEYHKSINSDKKSLNSSINRILSIDYKDKFIFSQTNVEDVFKLLIIGLNDIKKYKIPADKDLKSVISEIDFEKYDFFEMYANNEYLKNKEKEEKDKKERNDFSLSRLSSQCKSTTFSSFSVPIKDLSDEASENDENTPLLSIRQHMEPKSVCYIDNNDRNIIYSSFLDNEYIYNEEKENKIILTKDCFSYTKTNNKSSDKNKLPIELILILYKFRNVETLIFQIKNIDEQFCKMAIFILMNVNLLFIKGIKEVKFDLGNENLQYGINDNFRERTAELYRFFHKNKDCAYNTSGYQARTINLWEPENDIFFVKNEKISSNTKYLYNIQPKEESNTFDNQLCNIYNEIGYLTKLKYIRPINYSIKNNIQNDEFDDNNSIINSINNTNSELSNMSISDIQKMERDSISVDPKVLSKRLSLNTSQTNNESNDSNTNKKTTPSFFVPFVQKNKQYFDMIILYSYFLAKNLKKIAKLCVYFHTPYTYELCLLYDMTLNLDQTHFLILLNKLENLTDLEISFNSLDDKSFDYIHGIIFKNSNISSLKLSFFTPNINYFDDSLFYLCSSKKIGLTKLFQEQREYEMKYHLYNDKRMNDYILDVKLFEPFFLNLSNLFNLIKTKSLGKLNELIFRFDIPLPLLDKEKYIIIIIKFIINMLIMITFQKNLIHTVKLLSPELELNCSEKPYIRQLFKEILLSEDEVDKENDNNNLEETKTGETTKPTQSPKRNVLNTNNTLKHLTIQFKIYNLPELFNFCIRNNLNGLKTINFGTLDEATFIGFMNSYKKYSDELKSLETLKISLGLSVTSYTRLENYILDYININPPNLQEKYLLSNLQIIKENKMKELVELVYFKAVVPKLVIQIGNENTHMLSKILHKFILETRTELHSLCMIFMLEKYQKLRIGNILELLSSFYEKKKNRVILCIEEPTCSNI